MQPRFDIGKAPAAYKAMSDQYSVPGNEAATTNARIAKLYGNGGDSAPMEAVVTLPKTTTADDPAVQQALKEVEARIARAAPSTEGCVMWHASALMPNPTISA